jgi:hypothetical protein
VLSISGPKMMTKRFSFFVAVVSRTKYCTVQFRTIAIFRGRRGYYQFRQYTLATTLSRSAWSSSTFSKAALLLKK